MKSYHNMFGVTRGNIFNPWKHLAIISHFNIIFQVDLDPDLFVATFNNELVKCHGTHAAADARYPCRGRGVKLALVSSGCFGASFP